MNPFPTFVLLHVPHDSSAIPASIREQVLLDDAALKVELLKMTDHLTLDLFSRGVPSDRVVRAVVSRLVVDVERFEQDDLEPMSSFGMGVVYLKTSGGADLRRPISMGERQALLAAWYHPHHQLLGSATQDLLDQFGRVLVVDAHSFPSQPLPYEFDQRSDRPDICIGTDDFHTPVQLAQSFIGAFRADQFTVELNAPFAGAMVPQRHHLTDRRVSAVMIEVNRSLYLHEPTAEPNANFNEVATRIRRCIVEAIGLWDASVA